jgi:hypothetical protein
MHNDVVLDRCAPRDVRIASGWGSVQPLRRAAHSTRCAASNRERCRAAHRSSSELTAAAGVKLAPARAAARWISQNVALVVGDRLTAGLGDLHPHDQPASTCILRRGQGEATEQSLAPSRSR